MNNYTKTMWVDHLVENPDRYNIIYNSDGSITLSLLEGEVFQEGTPVNAIHLNKLEEGIYQALTGEILLGEFQGESRKLVLKKGTEATMPTLSEGELGYATDTRKLFMGTSNGNASVMPDIDVTGVVEEVIDRRVNHVKNKPLSQILIEEAQAIRDYFVSKITERINSVTNKPLNQVISDQINITKDVVNEWTTNCKNALSEHISAESNTTRHYITSGYVPIIKSIQTGIIKKSSGLYSNDYSFNIPTVFEDRAFTTYEDITISPVNVNKCIITCTEITPSYATYTNKAVYGFGKDRCRLTANNTLRIYANIMDLSANRAYIENVIWRVIEFY